MKHKKKAAKRLAKRIAHYDAIKGDKKGFRKPGSLNRRKTYSLKSR